MAGPISATFAQAKSWLQINGYQLGNGQFSYSLPGNGASWLGYAAGSEPFNSGYAPPTTALANGFRAAIATWDGLILPNFAEVTENGTQVGELRVAFTNTGGSYGYGYQGTPTTPGGKIGDIWLGSAAASDTFLSGTFSYQALLHEIGHALGLKHAFDEPAVPTEYDNYRYTIMSYTGIEMGIRFYIENDRIYSSTQTVVAATPMVLDIAAAQAIYGADPTTRNGDTVYSFKPHDAVVQTIYDAGGVDRIDASNFTSPVTIDLRAGSYSSIGIESAEDQIAYWSALFPTGASFIRSEITNTTNLFTYRDNVGIALGVTIENATGGSGKDMLTGNDVANVLDGGAGADTLAGGLGDDSYLVDNSDDVIIELAGQGNDTAIVSAGHYMLGADALVEVLNAAAGSAAINIAGNGYNQVINGNDGANIISGNGGDDTLNGGLGDDVYRIFSTGTVIGESGGFDTVYASGTSYFLYSTAEIEYLSAADQALTDPIYLVGNATSQQVSGNYGNNILNGRGGGNGNPDTLVGLYGDDVYAVFNQDDVVREVAGQGNDTVFANASYQLRREASIETLSAVYHLADGPDNAFTLRGNEVAQQVIGNYSDNVLDGRGGSDTLIGFGGSDTFAFTTALDAANNVDTITDFEGGDRIGLASDIFSAVTSGGIDAGEFVAGTAAADANDRLIYDQAAGKLYYDADGNGSGAQVLFAQLAAGTVLTSASFVVIAPVADLAAA